MSEDKLIEEIIRIVHVHTSTIMEGDTPVDDFDRDSCTQELRKLLQEWLAQKR